MKQPVIMQIIPELGPGGAEQGAIDVGAGIVRAGGRALVVSHGGDRVSELLRHKVEHITMPVHSKNPFVMLANIVRLKALIKKHKVDVVHVRSRAPAWSALYACRGTGAHYMTTCHAPYTMNGKWKTLYNSAMVRGERVIMISHMVMDFMKRHYGLDPDRLRLVHRGIAMNAFHPESVTPERVAKLAQEWRVPDGAHVVMLAGRLTRLKGHHLLIEALSLLKRDDVFCVFVGSDQGRVEYRREVEAFIAEKGLDGRVRIVDHCADMPAAYMLTDAVVSASTEPEGFGRIPVEAQAMGRPIIATDHGGVRETIVRGETGWLVPVGDAPLMAQALNEALSLNAEQREMLGARSMAHVNEHFTVDAMVRRTLDVYNELLGASGQVTLL